MKVLDLIIILMSSLYLQARAKIYSQKSQTVKIQNDLLFAREDYLLSKA